MSEEKADILYLLARAIDAKCRLDDHYQMFCCLENLLQQGTEEIVIQQILWSESSDPDGDELSFEWKFPDGSTAVGPIAVHQFTNSGSWIVTLFVSDGLLSDSTSKTINISSGVGIQSSAIPSDYSLSPAFPNPFNPVTSFSYSLPSTSAVWIQVTDIQGKVIKVLEGGSEYPAGTYTVRFNADGLSSGVYIVRMMANDFVQSREIVLLK